MRVITILFIVISISTGAQDVKKYPVDSAAYYQRIVSQLQRKAFDSVRNSEEYKTAQERIQYYQKRSDGYGSFVLFMDIAQADFSKLNTSITANGFTPIDGPVCRFGFGFSTKTRRTVVDFFLLAGGLRKEARKGQENIRAVFSSGVLLDIGFDLVKNQKINIYPYAGLSLRTSDLYYTKPVTTNPSFTDISNLVINKQSAEGSSIKLGYQAGMGFDFVIPDKKSQLGGCIFFVKAGMNRPVGKEKYKIEGIRYDPGIEYGKWIITAGVKFFGRQ